MTSSEVVQASLGPLPTTDPGVAGQLWNNGGFLCVSLGDTTGTVNFTGPVVMQNNTENATEPSLKVLSPDTGSPASTAHGLEVDNTTGAAGQLIQTFDNVGNPIWNLGAVGGPNVYGDNVAIGTAYVFGPDSGILKDGSGEDYYLSLTDTTPAAHHLFFGDGVPPDTLGANGDAYLRFDGSSGSMIYINVSGTWEAKI